MKTCHPIKPPEYPATDVPDTLVCFTDFHDSYPDEDQWWCSVCGSMYYTDEQFKEPRWHAPSEAKT